MAPWASQAFAHDLKTETCGAVTTVHFAGPKVVLDEAVTQAGARRLFVLVEGMGGCTLILSFAAVVYLTSTALSVTVTLHKRLKAAGGRLVLCGLSPAILETFQVTGLDRLLYIRGEPPDLFELGT